MSMIKKLKNIEKTVLVDMLKDPSIWKSLDIDYHPPRVERLYTDYDGYRICLHKIYFCRKEDALYHPHPWKAAFHILDGKYETGLGYSETTDKPKVLSTVISKGEMYYEMTDPNTWHYVKPLHKNDWCYSIMLSGDKFKDMNPAVQKSDKELKPLSDEKKESLLHSFLILLEEKI